MRARQLQSVRTINTTYPPLFGALQSGGFHIFVLSLPCSMHSFSQSVLLCWGGAGGEVFNWHQLLYGIGGNAKRRLCDCTELGTQPCNLRA